MSHLLLTNGGIGIMPCNREACSEEFFGNDELFYPDPYIASFSRVKNDLSDQVERWSFRTPWWPKHSGFIGDQGVDVSMLGLSPGSIDNIWLRAGVNGRFSFVGVTRDSNGVVLPNCTVRCFRTSTDELVAKVTSDANGYYIATSPYSDGHYLTVHSSTPSSTGGASTDNLTPG